MESIILAENELSGVQQDFLNQIKISGYIGDELCFDHEITGRRLYKTSITVRRQSGTVDILPVSLSEKFAIRNRHVTIEGDIRSYDKRGDDLKRHLILTTFVRKLIVDDEQKEDENNVLLLGKICKKPIYRVTPFGREITELMLEVHASYNRKFYIPCIAWGMKARMAYSLQVGTKIICEGRLQSREYEKVGTFHTAYEVSLSNLTMI